MSSPRYDNVFKSIFYIKKSVLLIGDSNVGKTNLYLRFIKDEFNFQYKSTLGVEFAAKQISYKDRVIMAQIWDTCILPLIYIFIYIAGQERYREVTSAYYKAAIGALVVYDITNRDSFDNLPIWINSLKNKTDDDLYVTIVGNKIDLEDKRVVSKEEGEKYAKINHFGFIETSALSDINVKTVFVDLMNSISFIL